MSIQGYARFQEVRSGDIVIQRNSPEGSAESGGGLDVQAF